MPDLMANLIGSREIHIWIQRPTVMPPTDPAATNLALRETMNMLTVPRSILTLYLCAMTKSGESQAKIICV